MVTYHGIYINMEALVICDWLDAFTGTANRNEIGIHQCGSFLNERNGYDAPNLAATGLFRYRLGIHSNKDASAYCRGSRHL